MIGWKVSELVFRGKDKIGKLCVGAYTLSFLFLVMSELKANDLLLFLRPHDPCWESEEGKVYCLDQLFMDEEGYYCDGYEDATEEECKAKDEFTGKTANEMCCGCGGGERLAPGPGQLPSGAPAARNRGRDREPVWR